MGGAQLGSMPEIFEYEVTEHDAVDLVRTVLEGPIRFLDTSNGYADGRSESRIGPAVRERGGLPGASQWSGCVATESISCQDSSGMR